MKFGMILLVLLMLCALAGSLIPQGAETMRYVHQYGARAATLLLFLGLTDIFNTWYFIALSALLCLNLVFCSIVRFPRAMGAAKALRQRTAQAGDDAPLTPEQRTRLLSWLGAHGFAEREGVFLRNRAGFFGSFLVHVSILVILAFGSLVLLGPEISDRTLMPGETLTLSDGTRLSCDAFSIQDATGRLDYASTLRMTSADGTREAEQVVRVNEPLRFLSYKVYQNTYGTAGQITVTNADGAQDLFYVTEPCFLSIDGQNGLYFVGLYPGYVQESDGGYTLVSASASSYEDPVYDVRSISGGMSTSVLAFPGETLAIGTMRFAFGDPVEYPGLRIKRVSPALFAGLYFGFLLMVVALYGCFFTIPVCVKVSETGYAVRSPKDAQGLLMDIELLLAEDDPHKEEKTS